jgi:hypothetical protein
VTERYDDVGDDVKGCCASLEEIKTDLKRASKRSFVFGNSCCEIKNGQEQSHTCRGARQARPRRRAKLEQQPLTASNHKVTFFLLIAKG